MLYRNKNTGFVVSVMKGTKLPEVYEPLKRMATKTTSPKNTQKKPAKKTKVVKKKQDKSQKRGDE